jgi:hypothetical protein
MRWLALAGMVAACGCDEHVLLGSLLAQPGDGGSPDLVTTGRLVAGQPIPVGVGPTAVALADLDGDGHLDAITSDGVVDTVSVLAGDGAGGLGARTAYPVGHTPSALAVGRLHDGVTLAVATANAGADGVSVLPGDGAGHLLAATSYPTGGAAGSAPTALAAADLDGDGLDDLVVANSGNDTLSVLRAPLGGGAGGSSTEIASSGGPTCVAAGRIHPQAVDLVVGHGRTGDVALLIGDGAGSFTTGTYTPLLDTSLSANLLFDLDGDGILDAVTAARIGKLGATVFVQLGGPEPTLAPPVPFQVGQGVSSVAAGDFDGDGRIDLATADRDDGTVSILAGRGDGTFQAARTLPAPGARGLAAGDLDGDGRTDLVVVSETLDAVTVFLQR